MKRHYDQEVRNAVKFMGIPLQDAVRTACETPAEILSPSEKGRMRPAGADAEIVVLSTECMVEESIAASETVYRGGENHGR